MKPEWSKIFANKDSKPKIEERPYRCVICNTDKARFKNSSGYSSHMSIRHKNHKGFDMSLPKLSARKGFELPKIQKKKKEKKKKFQSRKAALDSTRAKSGTRTKIPRKDYLKMIKSYEKRGKMSAEEWGVDNGVKNPTARVGDCKTALKKRAWKEAEI